MPSGFWASEFSNSAAFSFLAAPLFHHTQNVSLSVLLAIFTFFLLYGGPFVLPAGHFAKSPWPMSEMCPSM
jgi:hypothetical protein